jgi:hypothetical protein
MAESRNKNKERLMTDHAHNFKDLSGKRFGRWLVKERSTRTVLDGRGKKRKGCNKVRAVRWVCECDCGTVSEVGGEKLRQKKSRSCGCINAHDLTGKKFGTWTAIKLARDPEGNLAWLCKCEKTGVYALFTRAMLKAKNSPPCLDDLPAPKAGNKVSGDFGSWKRCGTGGDNVYDEEKDKEWIVAKGCEGLELFQCVRSGWQILVEKGTMTKDKPLRCPADWIRPKPNKAVDYRGQVFGDWKVIERSDATTANRVAVWACECIRCGKARQIPSVSLENASSCDCEKEKKDDGEKKHSVAQAITKA